MNGLILLFPLFAFLELFLSNAALSTVSVKPKHQTVTENENVVIDCTDSQKGKVRWERRYNLNLKQLNGKLIIPNIKYEERGNYVCFNKDNKYEIASIDVIPKTTALSTAAAFNSLKQSTSLVTQGLPTTSNPVIHYTEIITTPYSCIYGVCNGTCCRSDSVESFFDCANGQKINKSLVCNRENDCDDGSDESRCVPWPSKITVLPKDKVEVYCGDQDKEKSGTLILECESVGHPVPLIRWKKYDGHVPSKCTQYSKRGHGILKCPDFQQSDQGAYSCVAENSVKSAESQPKSLAKCSNTINCRGFRVVNEEKFEHCLECYCSGKTKECQNLKSNLTVTKLSFPESYTEIFVKENGEIVFFPTKNFSTPNDKVRKSAQKITYCVLSQTDFIETSFLKSFGRSIIIPRYKGKTDFMINAPDLIIRGNDLSLMYTAKLISLHKNNVMDVSVRFWPGNWHHLNKKTAKREDLMRVLSNVDTLFIRCEYQQGNIAKWDEKAAVFLESSIITDFTKSVSYVEKCNCPFGYDGLSCESCAAGYTKKLQGNDFFCERTYTPPPPCKEGYKGVNCSDCDTIKGYYKKGDACKKSFCHPDGSVSLFPNSANASQDKCICKEGVTGDSCDKCQNGSFYLHKARGCLKCWCSGVTNQCNSSNLRRTVISNIPRGGYNASDGRNFWLLPTDFGGNRLTSYGGYLNYTMKFKPNTPKENTHLTVEFLSMDDVTLIYTHNSIDNSLIRNEKFWSVPLNEINWKNSDKTIVTRGEFLSVLSKIKAIYIESPYHLSSGLANLTSARMSSAALNGDDKNNIALEVEQCKCPKGYTGLSCESCSEGYYRKRNGTVTQCIKCNCNYCDPEFGCPDCPQLMYRDNPEEEKIPVCKPCPCNGNGVFCVKDDLNQIFCRCKPGFIGMHCETLVPKKNYELTVSISPRRIKGKKVGDRVYFNCSVSSGEEMVLSAKKKLSSSSQSLLKSGSDYSQGSKIVKNFEVVLEVGLEAVECFVFDVQEKLAGHVVAVIEDLITVLEPVKITNCYSDRIEVKEMEKKDIICTATGSPAPIINWYKIQKNSTAEKVDTSDGVHSIESALLSDNGTIYSCIAENSEGDRTTCSKVLIVRKKCEVINIFPKNVRVVEGKNISIQCKTTAKSPVTWSILDPRYGKEHSINSQRISVKAGYLHFTNASVYDSGTYICTANGENGKINKTISVIIEEKRVPPLVYIQEYDKKLKLNESFEANCIATGKPVPVVTWKKVNGSFENNVLIIKNKLKINNATVKNSGIYWCEAVSSAGSASSYISIEVEKIFSPKINISDESIKAYEGEEVTLGCLAIGNPRPKLSWFARNVTFTNITRKTDDMIRVEPVLSIKEEVTFKVTKNLDNFVITCLAENAFGKAETSSKIKVLQSKGGINETVEFVRIGSYFELNCDFPGDLEWEKLDGGLVGDECPIPNGLMIISVQNQHNGTYICTANSDSKKVINLIVIGFVPKFSAAMKSYLVLPVQLKSANEIRIELSFNSSSEDGLLIQKEDNRLKIYLEKGKIHLSVGVKKEEPLDFAMIKPIHLGIWHSLIVSIDRNHVDITLYDEKGNIQERKTERAKDLNIKLGVDRDSFIIGGPLTKVRHLRQMFSKRHSYFSGCISRLNIDLHEFDIVKEGSYSHNVTLCKRCSEEENLCSKKAKCLDAPTQYGFICVCPDDVESNKAACPPSCVGKGCETQLDLCALLNPCGGGFVHKCTNKMYNLQCQCAYGYSGTTCEKVQEYSFCAKGNGYVRLPSNLLERHLGVPEVIRMSFTLHKPSGQLLWQGDRANYLSISVNDGKLNYVYYNQLSKLEVQGAGKLAVNKKHMLIVRRINNTAILEIDWSTHPKATPETARNVTYKVNTNRVVGDIYLGHVPNSVLHVGRHEGLNGCIHYVMFGEKPKVYLQENELERFNVFLPHKMYRDSDYDNEEYDYNNEVYSDYESSLNKRET